MTATLKRKERKTMHFKYDNILLPETAKLFDCQPSSKYLDDLNQSQIHKSLWTLKMLK